MRRRQWHGGARQHSTRRNGRAANGQTLAAQTLHVRKVEAGGMRAAITQTLRAVDNMHMRSGGGGGLCICAAFCAVQVASVAAP